MLPQIEIFGFEIVTYSLIIALSFTIIVIITLIESKRYKIELWKSICLCTIIVVFGFIGIRGLALSQSLIDNPSNASGGGSRLFGGIILVFLAGNIYQKVLKDGRLLDSCTVGAFSGIALSKMACFCAGCCKGITMPHGISFIGEEGVYRFPIQLVESGFTLLIVLIIILLRKDNKGKGHLFLIALICYSFARICLEFLREEQPILLVFRYGQVISILVLTITAIYYLTKKIITNKKAIN